MHGLVPADHLLALVLAVFFPIRSATFGYRRLVTAAETDVPRVRVWLYRQAIVIQWTLSALLAALWLGMRRPWLDLGLVWRGGMRTNLALLGVSIAVAGVAFQIPRILRDPETLARIRRRLAHMPRMIPSGDDEMRLFYLLSFTAGVCEEFLFRGFLFWYAAHFMPWPWAAVTTVLLFGIGHSYQGPTGILTTSIAGAVFMMLYLASGSLYLSMLVHALMDSYSGTVGRRAFAAEPPAITGVPPV
jgi:membrane protease YdiL (CAAX protease family)